MATDPWSWESKRWTVLASLVVLACLYGVMWYLMGGCEVAPERPTEATGSGGADPTLNAIEAMGDANVAELALHAAWFHTRHGRLPADLDELAKADRPAGWPPTPTATADGQAIAYRVTGGPTYELVLSGQDGTADTPDDMPLAMTVPDDMPLHLPPHALRTWWDLEHARAMMEKIRRRIQDLAPKTD